MNNEVSNKCCGGNKAKISDEININNLCPVCGKQGSLVKNITVKNMVIDELTELIDDDYFLCTSDDCDVSYYNPKSSNKFNKHQVKAPIWFKRGANPKYACYCSQVTEGQVINAVVKDGATNMKEVLKITGAMSNSQCQTKNPLGKCCHQIIKEAIDKGLSIKK